MAKNSLDATMEAILQNVHGVPYIVMATAQALKVPLDKAFQIVLEGHGIVPHVNPVDGPLIDRFVSACAVFSAATQLHDQKQRNEAFSLATTLAKDITLADLGVGVAGAP